MAKEFKPLEVVAKKDEHIDRLVRRFIKKVRADGVLDELREKSHYEKPSVKRRRKHMKALLEKKKQEQHEG